MAGGFGYQDYARSMPAQVGRMLSQGRPQMAPPEPGPMPSAAPEGAEGGMIDTAAVDTSSSGITEPWPSASVATLRNAIQRVLSRQQGPTNPPIPNPNNLEQMVRLGIPPRDAMIMQATGGSNP